MIHFTERLEPEKILQLLSRALPWYLASWRECDETTGLFGSIDPSSRNMRHLGRSSPVIEYVVNPHLNILTSLAVFLFHGREELLQQHISKELAVSRIEKGLRWACETHVTGSRDVESFLQRRRWGENWRSSAWASQAAVCATLARTAIPDGLYRQVGGIVAHEANRFMHLLPPSGCEFDTKVEENAQDAAVVAWACAMHDDHPHLAQWHRVLALWSLNSATTIFDKGDHTPFDGSSISRRIVTQTLYPDMTAENHGFFHPETLSYGSWIVLAMTAFRLSGKPIPDFLHRKVHQITSSILMRFCLPNGLLYAPGGQDLPCFVPRPFCLAWGLWHGDPRAGFLTARLLSWMEGLLPGDARDDVPWVKGLGPHREGWTLFYQSRVGFELSLLAALPFERPSRPVSQGRVESSIDTRHIYQYVQVCLRRNARATRSVAWKTLDGHPIIGMCHHGFPELVEIHSGSLLGIPAAQPRVTGWETAFHNDRYTKEGFDTFGRIDYYAASDSLLFTRQIRVITCAGDGLFIFDRIRAEQGVELDDQFLSPMYIVNDHWTSHRISLSSGSLRESINGLKNGGRVIFCPSFWICIEGHLLVQLLWKRSKGLAYIPARRRNAPPYWKNCRLDRIGVHTEEQSLAPGGIAYESGLYVGRGKTPRSFKCMGNAGDFFKGLVIMDGRNMMGLD